MLKPAFSTVACPDWTLKHVAERALAHGFEAVELRTFGDASKHFACDPSLTAEGKVRQLFQQRGVEVLSLATGIRFDEPIWPPVIGLYTAKREAAVREGKRTIDLAVGIECPFVRVFAYQYPLRERRISALKRITDRLKMVVDHADKSGVKVAIENGGSFMTAAEILEIVEMIDSPLLGVSYNNAVAGLAGENAAEGAAKLGTRLMVARIKDVKNGRPVHLGEGELDCAGYVQALIRSGFAGPLVFEWDKAWVDDLSSSEAALKDASAKIHGWLGAAQVASRASASRPVSPDRIGGPGWTWAAPAR